MNEIWGDFLWGSDVEKESKDQSSFPDDWIALCKTNDGQSTLLLHTCLCRQSKENPLKKLSKFEHHQQDIYHIEESCDDKHGFWECASSFQDIFWEQMKWQRTAVNVLIARIEW